MIIDAEPPEDLSHWATAHLESLLADCELSLSSLRVLEPADNRVSRLYKSWVQALKTELGKRKPS